MTKHCQVEALIGERLSADGKALSSERLGTDVRTLAGEGVVAGRIIMNLKAQETPEAAKRWSEELDNALDHQAVLDAAELARIASTGALPVIQHPVVMAPNVPPPITRRHPARVVANIETIDKVMPVSQFHKYLYWTFNEGVPGPFIRARVGDTLELNFTNRDSSGMAHNIDMHCVTGPGGGGPCTFAEQDETKTGIFKLMHPGLFVYHCAAAPVPQHIQNGMFGMILVEPEEGLPPVDREFYVMQHEIYAVESEDDSSMLEPDYESGLAEKPMYVLFNGKENALVNKPLMSRQGERVRIFFGNAGPNLASSFHIIGQIFDKLYRDADLISPPARSVQTTLVPAGGATVVEVNAVVPGTYTLVDHSMFRLDKGAVGFLKVKGAPRPDVYDSKAMPITCPNCKLHD
jgi:copper-containing nitrite reductase